MATVSSSVGVRFPGSVSPAARWFAPIGVLTTAMFLAAMLTANLGGPLPFANVAFYNRGELLIAPLAVLILVFAQVVTCARSRAPFVEAWQSIWPRLALLPLPLIVFPIFLGCFSATKMAIPILVGYHSDAVLTAVDKALFGGDPWRILHAALGPAGVRLTEVAYFGIWMLALPAAAVFVPLFASRNTAGRFYATLMATWFFGGFLGAYFLSSTGPAFVHLVDPSLGAYFAPMGADLLKWAEPNSLILTATAYLEKAYGSNGAIGGGAGISAMPSMHVATATIYALAGRRTILFWPAVAFAILITIVSVYCGFHYLVDAPAGAAIAIVCWKFAGRFYGEDGADA